MTTSKNLNFLNAETETEIQTKINLYTLKLGLFVQNCLKLLCYRAYVSKKSFLCVFKNSNYV